MPKLDGIFVARASSTSVRFLIVTLNSRTDRNGKLVLRAGRGGRVRLPGSVAVRVLRTGFLRYCMRWARHQELADQTRGARVALGRPRRAQDIERGEGKLLMEKEQLSEEEAYPTPL